MGVVDATDSSISYVKSVVGAKVKYFNEGYGGKDGSEDQQNGFGPRALQLEY